MAIYECVYIVLGLLWFLSKSSSFQSSSKLLIILHHKWVDTGSVSTHNTATISWWCAPENNLSWLHLLFHQLEEKEVNSSSSTIQMIVSIVFCHTYGQHLNIIIWYNSSDVDTEAVSSHWRWWWWININRSLGEEWKLDDFKINYSCPIFSKLNHEVEDKITIYIDYIQPIQEQYKYMELHFIILENESSFILGISKNIMEKQFFGLQLYLHILIQFT